MAKHKLTIPLGLLIPGLLGTFDLVKGVMAQNNGYDQMRVAIQKTLGMDIGGAWKGFNWRAATFTLGWGIGAGVHYGVGNLMGVNKQLGRIGVPIIRV
jgi:hypothetical protein